MTPTHWMTEKISTLKQIGKAETCYTIISIPHEEPYSWREAPTPFFFLRKGFGLHIKHPNFYGCHRGDWFPNYPMRLYICQSPRDHLKQRGSLKQNSLSPPPVQKKQAKMQAPSFSLSRFWLYTFPAAASVKLLISLHLGAEWDLLGVGMGCFLLQVLSNNKTVFSFSLAGTCPHI